MNATLEKMKTSVAERLTGASRDLRMCSCINWQEENMHESTIISPIFFLKNSGLI